MFPDGLCDELEIVRYQAGKGLEKIEDPVVRETMLRVFLNENEIVVLQSLKHEVRELALGFLYTECVINDIDGVTDIEIIDGLHAVRVNTTEETRKGSVPTVRSVTSGCGAGVSFINPVQSEYFRKIETGATLKADVILDLMRKLMKSSKLFTETGGVHTAALSDGKELVHVSDDIGRHNCVDKVIGWDLLNKEFKSDTKVILSSGRLSSDIVSKSIRGRAQFVVSHSAPTRGAIQLARDFGITLIGFVRGSRYNIYSHEERITI